ncbi:hypothetical protein [Glycomyces sp. NRRL B-16210]|uniref:CdiA C-terminal domain-containing protein n=1 Tax=Glycomyces sp. NRRL B-16210 TaxID=1463821 RepID=UPI001061AF4C|nr:hypothetical protein [Glycomyces sp. NRRL B-16210]
MASIDEASSAVGGNAERARELAGGISASKETLDSLAGATAALGMRTKAGEAQAASDRAEELVGHANALADALEALRAQVEALRGLLATRGGGTAGPETKGLQPTASPPSVTKPAHEPDPTRRPTGDPTDTDGGKSRGLVRENESAIVLARNGYDIKQLPPKPIGKSPDYLIQGNFWDCYAPIGSNMNSIRTRIRKKVKEEQANRIILNLDDCGATVAQIRSRLERDPIRGLKEIKIIHKGEVKQLYPWDSEVD